MKGEEPKALPTEYQIAEFQFGRDGKLAPIELVFKTLYDLKTRETRVEVTIPNANLIVLPDDLGVLLQCFGWGMAGMGCDLKKGKAAETWRACCQVITKVEHCLRLE